MSRVFKSQRRGQDVARYVQLARGGAQGGQSPAIAAGAHRDETGLHFQHQRIAAQFQGAAYVRGAERRDDRRKPFHTRA